MCSKRFAVISDNSTLVDSFKRAMNKHAVKDGDFEFFYSQKNRTPEALRKRNCKPIDLASSDDVSYLIREFRIVFSAHCKQVFPEALVRGVTCINIHPGYNPYNRGWFPQVFSIINSFPIGATIHLMDEKIDHGPIIFQETVSIDVTDTSLDVYSKVLERESEMIEMYLPKLLRLDFETKTPTSAGNYNSISDFRQLCKLDMNQVATLEEHIDLLRALTHGDYQNAFFEKDGQRIYVRLSLIRSEQI